MKVSGRLYNVDGFIGDSVNEGTCSYTYAKHYLC